MQVTATVSQVYVTILLSRNFNQTEIARLTGIHRVTIHNIANGNYTGNTSAYKLKKIIDRLDLSNEEKKLIYNATLHIPITVYETPTQPAPTQPAPTQPAPTQVKQQSPYQVDRIIKQEESGLIVAKYFRENKPCMLCKNSLGNTAIPGYFRGRYVIFCQKCANNHSNELYPIPT